MELEKLKKRIDTIAARRMIRESREHFDGPRRPGNPAWNDVICDWCGKEFNESKPVKSKHYCSDECRMKAYETSKSSRNEILRKQRAHRRAKAQAKKPGVDAYDLGLLQMVEESRLGRFTASDVAKIAGVKNSGATIRRWSVAGLIQKHSDKIKNGKIVVVWKIRAKEAKAA